ncbi:hypothetical protein [Paenibacillus sp. FSL K6-1230]|uniref:hypothetical protein n=1 Tax=Paenibacillus sp. FSL K6-1230 TaxID=2921603 RepID=UPI0030F5652F
MKLVEKIQSVLQRVTNRVCELREKLDQDKKIMDELEYQYFEATSGDEINKVNDQIKEVAERMQQNKDLIDVLSNHNNPVIQSMIIQEVEEQLDQLNGIEIKARSLYKSLVKQRLEMMKGLAALNELNNKNKGIQAYVGSLVIQLNDVSRDSIGLKEFSKPGINVYDFINKLFIERSQVYK